MKTIVSSFLKVVLPLAVLAIIFLVVRQNLRPEAFVVEASRGVAIDAVPGSVTVSPAFDLTIKTEVGGRMLRSDMTLGGLVAEGDFLFEIDPTDLKLQYETFKAEYDAFRASLEKRLADEVALNNKREDLEDSERRFRQGEISQIEIERARQNYQLLLEDFELKRIRDQRELRVKEIGLQEWERTLQRTVVKAPAAGIITQIFAYPGEMVGAGSNIAQLFSEKLLVEARVNEENFAGIRQGQPARIRFLTYGDRLFNAEVDRVLPTADPDTQQYTVYLTVEDAENLLLPGLTGEVSIIRNRREDGLLVPRRALFGQHLFVVSGGRVEMRRVQTGFLGLHHAEIRDGLEDGELVIADGIDRFRDGDTVRVTLAQ